MSKLRKGLACAAVLASCEPALMVGELVCPPSDGGAPGIDANGVLKGCETSSGAAGIGGNAGNAGTSAGMGAASGETTGGVSLGGDGSEVCPEGGAIGNGNGPFDGPLEAPWKTSFDAGFCSYYDGAGFCYATPEASYHLVTSPVHSGMFAAAFDMKPGSGGARHARCVREGVLPVEAYYGAWYYIPSDLSGARDWNLFHFQGGKPGALFHGLWDVSMNETTGNGLALFVFNAIQNGHYGQVDPKPVPKDRWFQIEFYLKRAADATGEVALYQDGEEVVRRTGLVTDDSAFGQWYVGNYAGAFDNTLATVSVYVDDVTVRLP